MKVPPKRKGNLRPSVLCEVSVTCLNESPSEKEGKFSENLNPISILQGLNESPSEKEGKSRRADEAVYRRVRPRLNESPSEKEGKSVGKSSL